MMIRSNGRYFDFNGDIEMERRVKLFQRIDETLGDFSYEFELPWTSNNFAIFGYPLPDAVKAIYKSVHAEILDNDGVPIYVGQIRLDRYVTNIAIYCSFFSGNYNWIGLLSGNLSDIDFSDLDTDLTEANIINTGINTDGIFFPLLDIGGLITRGGPNLVLKDFTGTIFLKTAFKRIFQKAGVKLQGDLMTDPIFNSALISRINIESEAINNRSSFVGLGSDVSYSLSPGVSPDDKLLFSDETTIPYFDGSQNNFATSTYTADIQMEVKIESFFRWLQTSPVVPGNDNRLFFKVYINGVSAFEKIVAVEDPTNSTSITYDVMLEAGDTVEWYVSFDIFPDPIDVTIYADSWVKVTPTFLYRVFGNSLLPNWTQANFVGNVLSLFCAICDYEPVSHTLTIDLFNNIKTKSSVDLSKFINVQSVKTSEFIQDFSKSNILKYGDSDFDEIAQYNVKYAEPYAAGVIDIDNDFIPASGTLLETDFKAPVSYIHPAFSTSLERVNFIEMIEKNSTEFTSIQSNAGLSQLNMPDASLFTRLDLCRIEDSTIPEYNGDWLITAVSSTFIVIDRPFSTNATGRVTKLEHRFTNTNDVHIFIAVTYDVDNVVRFSNNEAYKLVENLYTNISYAFFNLLNTGNPINNQYTEGLAFGVVKNQLSYQRTLLEKYWPVVRDVLNDPVQLLCVGNLPKTSFLSLTPLKPIRIKSKETDNLYYLNTLTGYKNSYQDCEIELIKLS